MHRKEKIFILTALLLAVIVASFFYLCSRDEKPSIVIIQFDGKEYQRASLQHDQTILIQNENNYNEIMIQNKQVSMKQASCPDQVCVHQGIIDHAPNMIICLPNRVSIEIQSIDQGAPDAVLQ